MWPTGREFETPALERLVSEMTCYVWNRDVELYLVSHLWYVFGALVQLVVFNLVNLICLNLFTIKSRYSQMHLRKSDFMDRFLRATPMRRDVSIPIANSKWPIIGTEVLWDIMT